MNKFLMTLLTGAVALSIGSSAFADTAKPAEAAKPTVKKEKPFVPPAKKVKAKKKVEKADQAKADATAK